MATADGCVIDVAETGSTVFFDNICQPCENDGKIFEAEGRCEDCNEYLCKPCFLAHTVPSITRHHVLTGKDQLNTDVIQDRKDQCTQKCPQHDDEIIKYYCPSHSFLGCSACMILNHSLCSGKIYIPEVAKDVLSSEEYSSYKASKSTIETRSQEITTDVKERIQTFKTCHKGVVEKLRMFKKEIIDLFETAEKEIVDRSEEMTEEELKKQESILDKSAEVVKDMRASTTAVESLESKKQYCNMYIELMKTKDSINSCENRLDEIDRRKDTHRTIGFIPNQSIGAELLSCNSIGKIIDGIRQVTHERDINVKTHGDTKTCWISGSVMQPDNKLIITDHQNDKLKMIDIRQDKVVKELSMSSAPWDVTATSSNELAVTLPFEEKIAFVNTVRKLVNHRTIKVVGECSGVAYWENKLVVTFDDRPKVEVLDMNGVVLRTIASDDKRGADLKEPLCVVVSSVNQTIYISDNKCSKVVCLTSDGTLESTYTDVALGQPMGMEIDSLGNVYVCDWDKHTVHQITNDCKKMRILLTEKDVKKPYAISYCEAEGKFYIGMRENNIVKVFKVI